MCHRQTAQLRGKLKEFEKAGAQVLIVDPHEAYRVRHMLKRAGIKPGELNVPVLSDPAHLLSATYGVAFQMKIHTEWSNRPATFIVDREGVLRYAHRGTKYADRPTAEAILGELARIATAPAKNEL